MEISPGPSRTALSAIQYRHVTDEQVIPETPITVASRRLDRAGLDSFLLLDLLAPLSENGGRNGGLTFDQAIRALRILFQWQSTSAITITELNPDHGSEDGSTIIAFIDGDASAFSTD